MRLALPHVNRLLAKAHVPVQLRPASASHGEWMYGVWHPVDVTPSRHGWFTLREAILCAVTTHWQYVDMTTLTAREQAILFNNLSNETRHQLMKENIV